MELATFGGGCFWCTEAIFQRLRGVEGVESGYAGGKTENPNYSQVSSGQTGHAEVIQIKFNPKVISYEDLLDIFFATHDPTTPNRQGNDIGSQYRSIVFYHDKKQEKLTEQKINQLNVSGEFSKPIVTEIEPYDAFYKAEVYHQDYFNQNTGNAYCSVVISPKLEKLKKKFGKQLKDKVS